MAGKKTEKRISASCVICGNSCSYDRKTIKSDTYEVNGVKVVICLNCMDDLKAILTGEGRDEDDE